MSEQDLDRNEEASPHKLAEARKRGQVAKSTDVLSLAILGVATAGLFALAFGLSQQITAPIDALLNPLWPAVAGVVEVHPEKAARTLLRATRVSAVLAAGLVAVYRPGQRMTHVKPLPAGHRAAAGE